MKRFIAYLTFFYVALSYSQNQEATLHFKDGTSIFGYGDIKEFRKIIFRASKDGEPDIWTEVMVSGITFHGFEQDLEYRYMYKKEGQRYPLLFEVITEGEVTLYAEVPSIELFTPSVPSVSANVHMPSSIQLPISRSPIDLPDSKTYPDMNFTGYSSGTPSIKLYIHRTNEAALTNINSGFKRKIRAYFSDCPGLLKKVNNNEFGRPQIIELVNYYNDYCSELDEAKN